MFKSSLGHKKQKRPETTSGRFAFVRRSYVFVIPNTKMGEPGEEVLNERSEFRNLTPEWLANQRVRTGGTYERSVRSEYMELRKTH